MTDRIALFLGLAILSGLAVDYLVFDWSVALFLARRLADLIEWLAFWR